VTEGQIKAQVRAVRRKGEATAGALAIRADTAWSGQERVEIDGVVHRVSFCRSDLEVRNLLRGGREDGIPVVALCPFETGALAGDVLARLVKRRIHSPQASEQLASLFEVNRVDSRVNSSRELVNALVEHAPSDGYPPVATGFLDLQTAWTELINRLLEDRSVVTSVGRLFELSVRLGFVRRLEVLTGALRTAFFQWAAENVDVTYGWVEHLVAAKRTGDLLPIGLLFDLLLRPDLKGHADVKATWVRLESWFGGQPIELGAAKSWANAARAVLSQMRQQAGAASTVTQLLTRLDDLLSELRIADLALSSEHSPTGFELRVQRFAKDLAAATKPDADLARELPKLSASLKNVSGHLLASDHRQRVMRCEMAFRLARSLGASLFPSCGASLDKMVESYTIEGGFVDWARSIVQEGDSNAALNKAFTAVLSRVDTVCGTFEADFATKVAEWHQIGGPNHTGFLPIESTLDRLVAPIAAKVPALLLVMDGMSMAVFRELIGDLTERGKWLETLPEQVQMPCALLATVPSITEISRRALFRGELKPDATPGETAAFDSGERLHAAVGGAHKPRLFLKGDLQEGSEAGLSEELKDTISNKRCRLVAVVLNAIDDHLSGSDQVTPRWDLDYIRHLRELLQLAAEAGRAIILTSDHGHVLERKTTLKSGVGRGGDRYRFEGGPVVEGEISVQGQRVRDALGESAVTAAWSRELRYASKKRGYHGGVSPQELVVPLAILRHLKNDVPGWTDVTPAPFRPEWWSLTETSLPVAVAVPARSSSKKSQELDLFVTTWPAQESKGWISELLEGAVYAEASKRGVRGVPAASEVQRFLELLSERNGTVPRETLAAGLKLPLARLDGFVHNMARIFNIDGYEAVAVEGGSVLLNVAVLKKQFEITE
jgi:PglZ domain